MTVGMAFEIMHLLLAITTVMLASGRASKSGTKRTSGVFCLLCIMFLFTLTYSAVHGAAIRGNINPVKQEKILKLIHTNRRSHIVEKKLEPENGDIIIYVRYGCPDCMDAYNTLRGFAKENKNVYFISSRSVTGKILQKKYPTQVVPSAVIIGIPGKAWDLSGVNEDQKVLKRLITLRKEE